MCVVSTSRCEFTSPKVSSEAQNELKTLEGLEKKKTLTPWLPQAIFRALVRWSAAVLSKMMFFYKI